MRTIILLTVLSFIALPAFAQKYISWEAEDFNASSGTKFEVFEAHRITQVTLLKV